MSAPLTINDNNTSVAAQVGNKVEIHLNGNPTTGYSWTRAGFEGKESLNDEHLDVTSTYAQAPASAGLLGAGGSYTISVTPKKAGKHTVELVYARSFEGPKPDNQKFTVHLIAE
ncbi:inhibitor of cysteine peptidase [Novymonas esmeraldas]|uniref:Inhibitor of cysteine peptidase n=1 Tax=Novymonas esmeraldas TaxID=1808958 RepID=A0AAW0EU47_9TRYP